MRPIQSLDPTGQFLLERWPRRGRAGIPVGAEIVVEEGERAVLLAAEGEQVFDCGHHALAEPVGDGCVVFLRPAHSVPFLWGTPEPVSGPGGARYRGHGRLIARVADLGLCARVLAGERGLTTQEAVSAFLRGLVLESLTQGVTAASASAAFDLEGISACLVSALRPRLRDSGLVLDALEVLAWRAE